MLAGTDGLPQSGAARATIFAIYGPAVPLAPTVSAEAIRHDAELYPAHPRAPDFTQVNVGDYILNLK